MFTFTSLSSSWRSSAIRSRTGATAWHGPHHSAQKSTITAFSLWTTSSSHVCSVTGVDMNPFRQQFPGGITLTGCPDFPLYNRPMGQAFSPLPAVPDHPALELKVLERWERER